MNWQTFGPKLHKVGAYLAGASGSGIFATSGDTHSAWFMAASIMLAVGVACIVSGDIISIFTSDETLRFDFPPRVPMIAFALLALLSPTLSAGEGSGDFARGCALAFCFMFILPSILFLIVAFARGRKRRIIGDAPKVEYHLSSDQLDPDWTDTEEIKYRLLPGSRSAAVLPLLMIFVLLMLPGCQKEDAIAESNVDALAAVNAVAATIPNTANFIASTWADHETALAKRHYAASRLENSVLVTMPVTAPTSTTPATNLNPSPVRVVPETANSALQSLYDADIAQIAIGRQQIYQAVINQYSGNLAAAQALLQGQANYYATAGANQSTLQTGLNSALTVFQQFAPVLATAATKPATTAATAAKKKATNSISLSLHSPISK